jgi:hypothetical protein
MSNRLGSRSNSGWEADQLHKCVVWQARGFFTPQPRICARCTNIMCACASLPIQVIHDWPAPTTLTELRSFLGLANFYRRFVLEFSHFAWALSQITRGGGKVKFVWGQPQQQEFDDLKHHLCSTPVLSLPNLQQPFEIETDTSNYVVGFVLMSARPPHGLS